ncbi:hypothetical protein T4D_9399 [Trichinella pseudospiralis]|uniref:Uncharacterized protein n=1 Tax=Trichinella pseudospiralis TaxID=6337 RepID=A0A0V1FU13_TRIPS|nr:hypothetical protein T4D_9399 [Trichinella pseudospiralis]
MTVCKLSFNSSTFAWSQLSQSAGVLTNQRERFKYNKSDHWNEIRPQAKVQLDADDMPTPELLIDGRSKLTWLSDRLWRGVTDPLLRSLGTESIKTNCSPIASTMAHIFLISLSLLFLSLYNRPTAIAAIQTTTASIAH